VLDTSKKALHLCLKRIKEAKNENELRRLTGELQRIVFHRQYRNAEIKKPPPFTLAGEGEVPKTFLTSGMVPHGTEVQ
jgi:hypothetical protein